MKKIYVPNSQIREFESNVAEVFDSREGVVMDSYVGELNDGRMFVNGVEYFPSQEWNEPGKYKFHYHTWHRPEEELPYTDEQFYWMREPVTVDLKEGCNEIKLFVPKTFRGQRWSFGFVVTKD